jgi:hypothetical protein
MEDDLKKNILDGESLNNQKKFDVQLTVGLFGVMHICELNETIQHLI